MQLVDQAIGEHRADQRAAAAHVEIAVDVLLQILIASGSYGPMIFEFRHVASVRVAETTYLVVSLKNGAPGSSSAVRVDHAGSNIS